MTSSNTKHRRVAIIGGGVAGSLAAIVLAKSTAFESITLFDRDGAFGRGLAYSATAEWHRINVPAYKMGGLGADDSEGFQDWLSETTGTDWTDYSQSFVPVGDTATTSPPICPRLPTQAS
ncbi:FAD-dependent oxidoreductase [Tardiphaga alba]|nr:FAD-dependent oxidoreductase [Tardiphaga alba]